MVGVGLEIGIVLCITFVVFWACRDTDVRFLGAKNEPDRPTFP